MNSSTSQIKFTICVPVYESRALLPETLASIRAQTHTAWELVLVEDGSREPARDLVEQFASEVTQRVVYHSSPKNLGLPVTRDIAHSYATNPWIAVLDADDLWHPDHLEALAAAIERDPALEFVFTGFRIFTKSLAEEGQAFVPAPNQLADLTSALFFCKLLLQPSCFAISKSLLDRTGPWSGGVDRLPKFLASQSNFAEDRNFILRCQHSGARFGWTGKITSGYRKHPAAMTVKSTIGLVYRSAYFDIQGPLPGLPLAPQRKHIAHLQVNAARDLQKLGRRRSESAWFYWRAWCWYPWRVDRLALWLRDFCAAKIKPEPSGSSSN